MNFSLKLVSFTIGILLMTFTPTWSNENFEELTVHCSSLRMGQFLCDEVIDPSTQQLKGCESNNLANVLCHVVEGLRCRETNNRTFHKQIPCKYTNQYRYDTALLLSVFLGFLGADRFYLGHLGMGAFKCCTLGFLFIGHLLDIILIATEYLGPKDGSSFVVPYYGPSVQAVYADNLTYIVPREDWI